MNWGFVARLSLGFLVGLVSMIFIREFLENMLGWAGASTALRAIAIGAIGLVAIAFARRWKPHHILGALGTTLLGAMSGLCLLFSGV